MADEAEVKVDTYYLRPNAHHNVILKGENVRLDTAGAEVELTEEGFTNFRDKFFTAAEYAVYKDQVAETQASEAASTEVIETPEAPEAPAKPGKK